MLEQQLEQDIKAALLAHEAERVSTLRGLKSVLLNEKVAKGKRDTGLSDNEVLPLFAKEAKKRQESADLYVQGGDQARADKELAEKAMIEAYLPARLGEEEIAKVVETVIADTGANGLASMGQVIGQVKQKLGASADGAVIARIAREKLTS